MTELLVGAALGLVAGVGTGWWLARRTRPVPGAATATTTEAGGSVDVFETHPTGVVVADAAGRVVSRNAAARALAGTHVGVLIDAAVERHLELARQGRAGRETVELYGPPKKVVDVMSQPLPGGGAVTFIDDISERRRLDQVRTDFVANISHELKTPIGALAVLAETLVDERDPAVAQRLVTRMQDEADRASRTIDDLMELSRIETGGEPTGDPVRLGEVLRAAAERVTELAGRRRIAISTLGEASDQALVVTGDRTQLVSAVGNLVENAVKYSEPGGQVQVRLRRADPWVEVMVADQGVGIPQRDLDRIFERFYRVDRARSRDTGGTGLGLAIVRHVATNHGGEVTVTSTEGHGSTFVLRLPLDPDDTVSPNIVPPADAVPPGDPTRTSGAA